MATVRVTKVMTLPLSCLCVGYGLRGKGSVLGGLAWLLLFSIMFYFVVCVCRILGYTWLLSLNISLPLWDRGIIFKDFQEITFPYRTAIEGQYDGCTISSTSQKMDVGNEWKVCVCTWTELRLGMLCVAIGLLWSCPLRCPISKESPKKKSVCAGGEGKKVGGGIRRGEEGGGQGVRTTEVWRVCNFLPLSFIALRMLLCLWKVGERAGVCSLSLSHTLLSFLI